MTQIIDEISNKIEYHQKQTQHYIQVKRGLQQKCDHDFIEIGETRKHKALICTECDKLKTERL